MNKERLKRIASLIESLRPLAENLEAIQEEEQEYYDQMPESFQGSERGERSADAIDALETSTSELNAIIESLEGIA